MVYGLIIACLLLWLSAPAIIVVKGHFERSKYISIIALIVVPVLSLLVFRFNLSSVAEMAISIVAVLLVLIAASFFINFRMPPHAWPNGTEISFIICMCGLLVFSYVLTDHGGRAMACAYLPSLCEPVKAPSPGSTGSSWGNWQSVAQLAIALNATITTYLVARNNAESWRMTAFRTLLDTLNQLEAEVSSVTDPDSGYVFADGAPHEPLSNEIESITKDVFAIRSKIGMNDQNMLAARERSDVMGYVFFASITLMTAGALIYSATYQDQLISRLAAGALILSFLPTVTAVLTGYTGWAAEKARLETIRDLMRRVRVARAEIAEINRAQQP